VFTTAPSRLGRRAVLATVLISAAALAACGKDDPQAKLEAAVKALQAAIEARDTGDVMDLLDEHFQGSGNLDRDGTRRMLTATFLRFQNIKVIAMSSQARVDPQTPTLGRVKAQVLVTGAQGLIPERAEPYTVRMEWRLVGGDWKLADLRWDE
jgi:2C-methyl-D-erythritol 2,4-cyclodiphosphate synthase